MVHVKHVFNYRFILFNAFATEGHKRVSKVQVHKKAIQ